MSPQPVMTDRRPRLRFASDLLETVVELHVRERREAGDPGPYERYRHAADRLYALHPDPEGRLAAFRRLHAVLLEEWRCASPLAEATAGVAGRIDEVLVTQAWSRVDERSELGDDGRTVGLRILPARFLAPADLTRFLRHEFGHVADMLDETFGYGASLPPDAAGKTAALGERFGLLWDCSIDGRTARAGHPPLHAAEELEARCARLFPGIFGEAARLIVRRLWEGERPDYTVLIRGAADPADLAVWAGVALAVPEHGPLPIPGTPCPLCGFPTHDWASGIDVAVERLIQEDFPSWRRRDAACARCTEGYELQRVGVF